MSDKGELEKLEALNLRNFHTSVRHTMVTERSKLEDWDNNGRPHEWLLVEVDRKYSVYVDVAYGQLALFCGNRLVGTGKYSIITSEGVTVLDTGYYGVSDYIWYQKSNVNTLLTDC